LILNTILTLTLTLTPIPTPTLIPTPISVTICFCSSCHQFTIIKVEVYIAFSVYLVFGYVIITSDSFG